MSGPTPVDVPVYIPSRGEHLGAVVTVPAHRPEATIGVVLTAGRARDRTHRNATWVSTAHELAREGMYVLRLDYPGVGHSTGDPAIFSLEDPPVWAVEDACAFFTRNTPVTGVVLAGSCFGGRLVLHAAPRVPGVVGVVAAAIPVASRTPSLRRRIRRSVLRRRHRTGRGPRSGMRLRQQREGGPAASRHPSRALIKAFRGMARRGIRVNLLFGEEDFMYREFLAARPRLESPPSLLEVRVVPGAIHAFASADTQRVLREQVVWWARAVAESLNGRSDHTTIASRR